MNLVNPASGKIVHYDECDEAKGPGFDGLLSFPREIERLSEQWLNQAYRQVQTTGSRHIVWYFAERYAAEYAKDLYPEQCYVKCDWSARPEDPESIADRLQKYLDSLGGIHEALQSWSGR